MTQAYRYLLRLYPVHFRIIYGDEMWTAFERRKALVRRRRPLTMLRLVISELCLAVPDAACERIALLSSHPSFRGRCLRDLGVVRPPDVGKKEWFYEDGDTSASSANVPKDAADRP